ncbi:MAG: chromate transporter, partial [Desulfurococcaceae archaeon]
MNCSLIELFLVFLKVGLFMFGGGYASIALLHRELVVEHGWLSEEEFTDIIGLAESTPGPIAINSATYTGY